MVNWKILVTDLTPRIVIFGQFREIALSTISFLIYLLQVLGLEAGVLRNLE